jgi:tRNA-specific 2-thiouridylase
MSKTVVVAMSGGVDSAVSAHILKREGYRVVGITLKLLSDCSIERARSCCSAQSIEDARRCAERIGIPHYTIDVSNWFEERVIRYFIEEYSLGRTPNPCVVCNSEIKFGLLLNRAKQIGADYIATGHYARIDGDRIKKGIDPTKDQSYFLWQLSKEQISSALFPLGWYKKEDVRRIAMEIELPVAEKRESQEICFLEGDYKEFLKERLGEKCGEIVDKDGNVLGEHRGIWGFTIGQRRGLNLSRDKPFYVVKIDGEKNIVVVGEEEELYKDEIFAESVNWIEPSESATKAEAKIRYLHKEADCTVYPLEKNRVRVRFREHQRAPAPGQSLVFYKGDQMIGGGVITM